MVEREIEKKIFRLLRETPKSILLLGARQTGKSTLIHKLGVDLYVNLSDERTYLNYIRDPDLLRRAIGGLEKSPQTVCIDEIQRVPTLLNTIQALIDEKKIRFIITGSSARKLKRGQANLLPGRLFSLYLYPLTYWELETKWRESSLLRCLTVGSLPEIYLNDYGAELLSSYVDAYLREEIQAEALTRDLGAYSRFLDLAALLSGQYLNYSKISSDTEINKETIRRYFAILEETLMVYRIESFTDTTTGRKVRQKDRFIFFDLGVRNAILKKHTSTFLPTELGPLFEQWIFLQTIAYVKYNDKKWRISSYRDEYGNEVDLIIETEKHTHAFEIKYSKKYRDDWGKGCSTLANIAKKPVIKNIIFIGSENQRTKDHLFIMNYTYYFQNYLKKLK